MITLSPAFVTHSILTFFLFLCLLLKLAQTVLPTFVFHTIQSLFLYLSFSHPHILQSLYPSFSLHFSIIVFLSLCFYIVLFVCLLVLSISLSPTQFEFSIPKLSFLSFFVSLFPSLSLSLYFSIFHLLCYLVISLLPSVFSFLLLLFPSHYLNVLSPFHSLFLSLLFSLLFFYLTLYFTHSICNLSFLVSPSL